MLGMNSSSESIPIRNRFASLVRGGVKVLGVILAVAFIGVLAISGIFSKGMTHCSEAGDATAGVMTLHTQIIRYRSMAGAIPSESQGLAALAHKPDGDPAPRSWRQLERESGLIDPWGEPYQYRNPGKRNPESFDIFSKGPDKKEGTADDIYLPVD